MSSLRSAIRGAECLNQDTEFSLAAMLRREKPLRSDCDEQLIITFAFDVPVRVTQVVFEGALGSPHLPKSVRFLPNERNLIFATVERAKAADAVELRWRPHPKNPELAVAVAQLAKTAFISSSQLSIFVVDNEGGEDVTEIVGIDLIGDVAQGQGTSSLPKKG